MSYCDNERMGFYNQDYIDSEIELNGQIEEYVNNEIVCPYCGYKMDANVDDMEQGNFQDEKFKCENCDREFLLSYEMQISNYFTSKRK